MSAAAYVGSLDFEARKRSFENYILNESELLPDPYSLANEQWIDDVRWWPSVEFAILTLTRNVLLKAKVNPSQECN